MLDFKINKILASIFTPEMTIPNSLKLANLVVSIIGEYVGEEPSILPIPQNAPPEVPRILFGSAHDEWSLNISLQRTNLFYTVDPASAKNRISEEDFSLVADTFFGKYQKELSLRVQRLALVTERSSIGDNALTYMLERFCNTRQMGKGRPFHESKRFEIHSLKNYLWEGFHINSWVRMKFLPIRSGDQETAPGILVINDLNTLSLNEAPNENFSGSQMGGYFKKIPRELKQILNLYFEG
jgi:hypothetical protein